MYRRLSPVVGFTLIELLIVVAIIAILAAIAVPNFLEAQTRSKVSRVKADMRSYALGMEAYAVDFNRYPIPSDQDGHFIVNPNGAITVNPFETRVPVTLTTPIAYMSSRPVDPFAITRQGESQLFSCTTWDYVMIRSTYSPTTNWPLVWRRYFVEITGKPASPSVRYFIQSFGPDKDHDADIPHIIAPPAGHTHGRGTLYDPTNGTLSSGDIIYIGPGAGFPS